jgi:quinohemoprotein ethanol dehydrogenase
MKRLLSFELTHCIADGRRTSPRLLAAKVVFAGIIGLSAFCGAASAQNATPDRIKEVTSKVDSDFIKANTATSKDWPTIGLDYAETRFSKLNQINTDNVKDLGLVWSYNLESSRGVESTPVVVDGIMYQSRRHGAWSTR